MPTTRIWLTFLGKIWKKGENNKKIFFDIHPDKTWIF